jgi:hypothetical protein
MRGGKEAEDQRKNQAQTDAQENTRKYGDTKHIPHLSPQ